MKTLISVISFVAVAAWIPLSWSESNKVGQAQPSPTSTWNRIALEARRARTEAVSQYIVTSLIRMFRCAAPKRTDLAADVRLKAA
jgi:hypothetical protein